RRSVADGWLAARYGARAKGGGMMRFRTAIVVAALVTAGVVGGVRLLLSPRQSQAAVPSAKSDSASADGDGLRRRLITAAAVLTVLAVGGGLVAVSGIIPIKASSGHWAVTAWLLDFAKTRS